MKTLDKILAAIVAKPSTYSELAGHATDAGDLAWHLVTLKTSGRVVELGGVYRIA